MLLRKRRNQKSAGDRLQYELDFDLSPLEKHFMFWEYLEIGKSLDRFTVIVKYFIRIPWLSWNHFSQGIFIQEGLY